MGTCPLSPSCAVLTRQLWSWLREAGGIPTRFSIVVFPQRSVPTLLQPFWASMSTQQHENSGSHQSISVLQPIVLISGECGGHRKPSPYIRFSSHTGVQAVPPKACGHGAGLGLNSGTDFSLEERPVRNQQVLCRRNFHSVGLLPVMGGEQPAGAEAAPDVPAPVLGHELSVLRDTGDQPETVTGTRQPQPHALTLYRHQECGFPSERTRWHLPHRAAMGSTLVERNSPFYMCTTLSYDSYNKFIIPVFVRS